jgi:hypothetical protein
MSEPYNYKFVRRIMNKNSLVTDACTLENQLNRSKLLINGKCKGKTIPLQTLKGPEGFRRLRQSDIKKIGTCRW